MRALIALCLALAACGDDSDDKPRDRPATTQWSIGAPDARPSGTSFEIPQTGSINYVTQPTGSLAGKQRITLRYKVEMAEGVRIYPPSMPDGQASITLYFQRKGDDWSGQNLMNFYRWYATGNFHAPITAGEHTLTASLTDDLWTAINYGDSTTPRFTEALKDASRVGFVLGGGTGFGHGVTATGPATFTILDYRIE